MKFLFTLILIFGLSSSITCKNLTHSQSFNEIKWSLRSLNNAPLLPRTSITLAFTEETIHGNAGCNSYSGKYKNNANKLTIKDIMWTSMACFEPKGILQQESKYINILNNAKKIETVTGELIIYGTDKQKLVFTKIKPLNKKKITETKWRLQTIMINNIAGSTLRDHTPQIIFQQNSTISGYSGCNNFSAKYKIINNNIRISDLTITEQPCPNQISQNQEKTFIRLLNLINNFQINGHLLRLSVNIPENSDFLNFIAK